MHMIVHGIREAGGFTIRSLDALAEFSFTTESVSVSVRMVLQTPDSDNP